MQVLVLSHAYEPLNTTSLRRAIKMVTLGKVEIVETFENDVRTTDLVIKAPAVIRLVHAITLTRKKVKFNRRNVLARDHWKCQYCGKTGDESELTYDHVKPRTQGGKTDWDNIVCCCQACNLKKGGRTPEQAGMRLRSVPVRPDWVPVFTLHLRTVTIPEIWKPYCWQS
jgi:5-methylcytosine-specific restriction endonuclease McrA